MADGNCKKIEKNKKRVTRRKTSCPDLKSLYNTSLKIFVSFSVTNTLLIRVTFTYSHLLSGNGAALIEAYLVFFSTSSSIPE
jgi:hypothetical protein